MIFETPDGGSVGRRQAMQSSLPLQQEMYYPSQQPGTVLYDDYEEYHTSHRPTRVDSANDGFYRGEIQLDSMGRGQPRGAYGGDQETRFM